MSVTHTHRNPGVCTPDKYVYVYLYAVAIPMYADTAKSEIRVNQPGHYVRTMLLVFLQSLLPFEYVRGT